jgi:hypothetical protein
MFQPPDTARAKERLLIYGSEKVGKSTCWFDIANLCHYTRSPSRFYVLDTDFGVSATLERFPHLEDRITWESPDDWPATKEASTRLLSMTTPDDFFVIDLITAAFTDIKNWWIEKTYGNDVDEYYAMVRRLQQKAAEEAAKPGEKRRRGTDYDFGGIPGPAWDFITKGYLSWELPLTKRTRCHVIAVAEEQQLSNRGEIDKEDSIYQKYGFKPAGQKRLGGRFHTIVRVKRVQGMVNATVVEDRRGRWKGAVMLGEGITEGFGSRVMKEKWGWRI